MRYDPTTMTDNTPTFGRKRDGRDYTVRPGAYALVIHEAKVLIVEENSGWFLPGGGLEDGESPVDALHREMLEETGYRIEAPSKLTLVRQLTISRSDGTAYDKHCHIFTALLAERPQHGHCELRWVSVDEAVEKLAHECFRWVVEQYRDLAEAA